tara:strand:+ start:70 stop:774 length:705 start_codon:yes stop_codon:yes gene_type:complete
MLASRILLRTLALPALRPGSVRTRHALLQVEPRDEDERFMRLALEQASIAFRAGEVPIGSVLVREGECLAAEANRVEELQDASAHAEMNCLRAGAKSLGSWRLLDSTLYVTVEPCAMCMAAIQAFRVRRLVYGTVNPRLGAVESSMSGAAGAPHPYHSELRPRHQPTALTLLPLPAALTLCSCRHCTGLEVTTGVLADDASALMKSFFSKRREGDPSVDKPPQGLPSKPPSSDE